MPAQPRGCLSLCVGDLQGRSHPLLLGILCGQEVLLESGQKTCRGSLRSLPLSSRCQEERPLAIPVVREMSAGQWGKDSILWAQSSQKPGQKSHPSSHVHTVASLLAWVPRKCGDGWSRGPTGTCGQKIMQPDRPLIPVPHEGTATWEEGPSHLWKLHCRLNGPCSHTTELSRGVRKGKVCKGGDRQRELASRGL